MIKILYLLLCPHNRHTLMFSMHLLFMSVISIFLSVYYLHTFDYGLTLSRSQHALATCDHAAQCFKE